MIVTFDSLTLLVYKRQKADRHTLDFQGVDDANRKDETSPGEGHVGCVGVGCGGG